MSLKSKFPVSQASIVLLCTEECLFFCVIFFLGFGHPVLGQQSLEYTDGIVAVVNDDVITAYDVASFNVEEEKRIHAKYRAKNLENAEMRNQLLEELNSNLITATNELINQKLIYAEFVKKAYQLPTELIDKRIDSIVAAQANGDWKKFEEMVIESNTTMEEFRERIERNLAVELLLGQTVDRNINISPDQIERYYQEHIDEFTVPTNIRLQVIALKPQPNESDEEYDRRVQKVKALVKDGSKFSDVAKTHSDISNKEKGGDLGWMSVNDIRHEFKQGLKNFTKGEISEPIKLGNTTYFVHISELQPGSVTSLDELFNRIKSKIYSSEKQRLYEEYIDGLRSKSYVRFFFDE